MPVPGWRARHHQVAKVMVAMLFIAEQRAAHQPGLGLLTPRTDFKLTGTRPELPVREQS